MMLLDVPASPASYAPKESSRRLIVRLVLAIYVLLVMEGALRKWLLPEFGQVLFFVRDPLALATYALALASGHWPRAESWLNTGLAFGVGALLLAVLQMALGYSHPQFPLLFAAYGVRNYFFYLPLAFIIAGTFQSEDLERLARLTFLLISISAALVVAQFYSPVDAAINVGSSDNPLYQFRGLGLNEDHTRPMGFFTSDAGQKQLTISSLAMVLAAWGGGIAIGARWQWLLALATLSTLTCLAFSGSRGAVLHAAIVLLAGVLLLFRSGSTGKLRLSLSLTGLLMLAILLSTSLLGDGLAAFFERWNAAQAHESRIVAGGIFGRALYGFIDFLRFMADVPLVGNGIGLGGNANYTLAMAAGNPAVKQAAETDWARHIVDLGPVFGVAYIVYRVALCGMLASRALRSGELFAVLLCAYLLIELLYGQISGLGTINGYAWMFVGFVLAASRAKDHAQSRQVAAIVPERFPNLLR